MPQLTDDECMIYYDLQKSADALNEDELEGLNIALAEGMKLVAYINKVKQERLKNKVSEPEPQN